jgi:hypothetical protein
VHVRVALRRSVGHLLVAVATGLALLGASCTRDPAPPTASATPTATTPTTPSPTPTPTTPPPTLPATAHANTPAAAESFARHWLTALDYAYQTGNTTPLKELGDCRGCLALANSITRVYGEGGRIEGGRIVVQRARGRSFSPGDSATVEVYYSQSDGRTIYGDGRIGPVKGSARLAFLFTLKRVGNGWTITAVQPVEGG